MHRRFRSTRNADRRARLALLLTLAFSAAGVHAADLSLDIQNVRSAEGRIGVQLLNADGYAGKANAVLALMVAARTPVTHIELPRLAAGRYALRVMHDRNGNGALDKNFIGIPKEPFGFSNDAKGKLGPPDFEAAAFVVGATNLHLTITLQ